MTTARFDHLDAGCEFDLITHPVGQFLRNDSFLPSDEDRSRTGDLYDLQDDPLPDQLESVLPFIVTPWVGELRPKLLEAVASFTRPPKPKRTFISK